MRDTKEFTELLATHHCQIRTTALLHLLAKQPFSAVA